MLPPALRSAYPRLALLASLLLATAGGVYVTTSSHSQAASSRMSRSAPAPPPSSAPAPLPPAPLPAPAPSPTWVLAPLLQPGPVRIDTPGFWSWALLDQHTGTISGSKNLAATSTTASMIKAWIAADYLRRAAQRGQAPSSARLGELSTMIRDSDNEVAHAIFKLVGDAESIRRLVSICQLTETKPYSAYWSNTSISARDTARMADCIGDGRAAGPQWTDWLLDEMRSVRGFGDFGIRKALPADVAQRTAVKNGWIDRTDGNWHIACLAIGDGWTLGVLARYPISLGFSHGAMICQSVAAQLLRRG